MPMFEAFEFNNNSPIYLQITKFFEAMVFLGELKPGDLIPSRRELAGEMRVNLNTVQKSYAYMEEIGLITTEKNRYSVITKDTDKIEELKNNYIKEPLIIFLKTMKSINISKDSVLELIDKYYDIVDEMEGLEDDNCKESDKKI
ncbi:GntR family transcriptional regulator [Peptostreptococcus canis]|uniref:GntR family transcriptional regulator n=2 Tax=Peptostreptococcus canis TaxID=1159213 RepID=A0ABR6TNB8_9FIRM|nr:GntR family transcriptional regulator [Peptostreptococcus canis]